jgi:hypothetical protein
MKTELEQRVRDLLHDAADTVPPDASLVRRIEDATVRAPRPASRIGFAQRRWLMPVLSSAAIVAVAAAIVLIARLTHGSPHTPPATVATNPSPRTPSPPTSSAAPSPPTSSAAPSRPSSSAASSPTPTNRVSSAPPARGRTPTTSEIAEILRRTVETSHPSTHFGYPSAPVTTSDGTGGTFTAVTAARTPAADMHGFLVFFWHNQKFIGWDSNQETMSTRKVVSAGTGAFAVTYSDYASEDPACCPSRPPVTITYHWNGTRFQPSQPVPPGVYGLNNPYAVPVTVELQ